MATISNTPRPGYVWDATDNVWYPIGTGTHSHADYITQAAAISPTLVDAKGDIIAASAADTVARLAVGANDTVLTADSSTATGLKWATPAAGGMTLLSTTTLTGASITLSSIPATYNHLQMIVRNFKPATDNTSLQVRMNGDSTASRHRLFQDFVNMQPFNSTLWDGVYGDNTDAQGLFIYNIFDYANTTTWKTANATLFMNDNATPTSIEYAFYNAAYNQVGAISSIQLLPSTGNFTSGTVLLYGVK